MILAGPDDTRRLGRRLGELARAGDLIVLTGELGAGKTTLTQGIGEGLGVRGAITSPTFIVARVHPSAVGGPPLVHADAYRLTSLDDLETLDLDASLPESVTVVEWGAGFAEQLSEDRLEIALERPHGADPAAGSPANDREDASGAGTGTDGAEPRRVSLVGHGQRGRELAAALSDEGGRP